MSRCEFLTSRVQTTAGGLAAFSGITSLTCPERVFGASGRVRGGGVRRARPGHEQCRPTGRTRGGWYPRTVGKGLRTCYK
jgi:hypothetical protein